METSIPESGFPEHWDPQWVDARQQIERERERKQSGPRDADGVHLPFHYRFLRWGIKAIGLYPRGHRNFTDVGINRIEHRLEDWPAALDGFRILQLSDLHIDLDPALQPVLRRLIPPLECDLAVITGDYWEGSGRDPAEGLERLQEILGLLRPPPCGVFGILGNHDSLFLACELEKMGLPLLMNDAVTIYWKGLEFALAGVDDAYYFRTDDLKAAVSRCPPSIPRILLSHSPQLAKEAAAAGFCLMLSGHTHGGQICLPGGTSIVAMEGIPGPLFKGRWRVGRLTGYTTTGTGSCHVPVRYNCPPEIVIHTLRAQTG